MGTPVGTRSRQGRSWRQLSWRDLSWRDLSGRDLPGRGLPWQALPVAAWVLLAAGSLLPSGPPVDPRVSLCLVTVLSAAGCWARAVLPAQRAVWGWMAAGLTGYALGFVLPFADTSGEAGGPGGLNWSDCASLLLYPAGYAALALLTRSRVRSWAPATLLDGAIVPLAASAVAVTWVASSYPTLLEGGVLDVVYALVYPVGATTLLVVTLTGLAMTRWRVDPVWALLALGFTAMAVGDALYGVASAAGTFRFGTPLDAVYSAGPVLVCLAAWRRPAALRRDGDAQVAMVVPAVATLVALVVLVSDHVRAVPLAAVVLAAAVILLTVSRASLSWRQERVLTESRRLAQLDDLTGLPNRRALLELLPAPGRGTTVTGSAPGAFVVLLDLDGFREVNDTLGHAAGDRLLLEFADRLRAAAGESSVARLGGDQFALVLPAGRGTPAERAGRLRRDVSEVIVLDGCRISVRVSMGVALTAADGAGVVPAPAEVLRRADVARHRAKALGTGVEAWTSALDDGATDRLRLLAELRGALDATDQIVVHYQPQVDPVSGSVLAREALVRWQHPRRGLLAPGAFLEAVEQSGLLPELTSRVLDLVLGEQAALRAAGVTVRPVAVNVGAADLLDPGFAAATAGRLARHGLPSTCLRIEITEGVVMAEPDRILATLHQLEALGIGLSLDDYSTGLSSLTYLRLLPVDELKVDRSFVSRMTQDPVSALIVGSTVALAHGLGLRVVAEGVEDAETLTALAVTGCDLVQGYLLGRPAPSSAPPVRIPAPRPAYLPA